MIVLAIIQPFWFTQSLWHLPWLEDTLLLFSFWRKRAGSERPGFKSCFFQVLFMWLWPSWPLSVKQNNWQPISIVESECTNGYNQFADHTYGVNCKSNYWHNYLKTKQNGKDNLMLLYLKSFPWKIRWSLNMQWKHNSRSTSLAVYWYCRRILSTEVCWVAL